MLYRVRGIRRIYEAVPLGIPPQSWRDNVEGDLAEFAAIGNWTQMTQNRKRWRSSTDITDVVRSQEVDKCV